MPLRTLVIGGQRSGKSRHAEEIVAASGLAPVYVATATAGDGEMQERIVAHRARRGPHWRTVGEPLDLPGAVARAAGGLPRAGRLPHALGEQPARRRRGVEADRTPAEALARVSDRRCWSPTAGLGISTTCCTPRRCARHPQPARGDRRPGDSYRRGRGAEIRTTNSEGDYEPPTRIPPRSSPASMPARRPHPQPDPAG